MALRQLSVVCFKDAYRGLRRIDVKPIQQSAFCRTSSLSGLICRFHVYLSLALSKQGSVLAVVNAKGHKKDPHRFVIYPPYREGNLNRRRVSASVTTSSVGGNDESKDMHTSGGPGPGAGGPGVAGGGGGNVGDNDALKCPRCGGLCVLMEAPVGKDIVCSC